MSIPRGSAKLEITGIHHAGLPVADFERALAFYVGVLGLEHIQAPKAFAAGVRWLRMGDTQIHLIKSDSPLGPEGPRHIALHVKDVREAKKNLLALGYPLDAQPFIDRAERFYIKDPDGNSVELIQWFREWGDGSDQ